MNRPRATGAANAALALLAAGAPVILALVLYALPPTGLAAAGLGWVVLVMSGVISLTAALATLASLVVGLRDGSLAALLLAGAAAALVGGSLGVIGGADGMSLAVGAMAGLVVAVAVAERMETMVHGRTTRFASAAVAVLVTGALTTIEVIPAIGDAIEPAAPFLLFAAATTAGAAAVAATGLQVAVLAVLVAVGATSLGLARGQDANFVLGLVALLGSSLVIVRSMLVRATAPAPVGPDVFALPGVAHHVTDGVLRFDGRLQLRSWNWAAANMLVLDDASGGSRLDDLLGISLAQLPVSGEPYQGPSTAGGLEVALYRDADGMTVVLHDPSASRDADRLGRELRATIEELLQSRRTVDLQRAELARAATTDPLTGVASRAAILARLDLEFAEARRYQHPAAIVLLDVDGFGELNATHGIAVGDAILREVALRVRLRVRAADSLGRSSSDGFLAVLPHTDEAGAAAFADALRRRVAQRPVRIGDTDVVVTMSAGVAIIEAGDELDRDTLMACAEEALAGARRSGGDRVMMGVPRRPTSIDRHRAGRPPTASPADEGADESGA